SVCGGGNQRRARRRRRETALKVGVLRLPEAPVFVLTADERARRRVTEPADACCHLGIAVERIEHEPRADDEAEGPARRPHAAGGVARREQIVEAALAHLLRGLEALRSEEAPHLVVSSGEIEQVSE